MRYQSQNAGVTRVFKHVTARRVGLKAAETPFRIARRAADAQVGLTIRREVGLPLASPALDGGMDGYRGRQGGAGVYSA